MKAPSRKTSSCARARLRRVVAIAGGCAALCGGLLAGPLAAVAQAAAPVMSTYEIVARGESAIGTNYTWGGESWVPNQAGAGPDCSGLVLKSWEVPQTLLYQEEDGVNADIIPRYTTYHFYYLLGPWSEVSDRSQLRKGDILVRYSGGSGHVVLYDQGDGWNNPIIYEAPYTGAQVRRVSRYLDSSYRARRRDNLGDDSILLDNPTAKSTGGSDVSGNWARSTSNAGYYGQNYQVQAATSATAWARWTPRLPATGYYNVYLRWTSGWNRASNARVHINTTNGQLVRYVDQRSSGGAWVKLGRFYFGEGYSTGSGSISIFATGANGFVVADAVLFAPTR